LAAASGQSSIFFDYFMTSTETAREFDIPDEGSTRDPVYAEAKLRHHVRCGIHRDLDVHFLKDSINQVVWWSLGTRAGGEMIASDSY
jgi:hypothetical protein